MVLAEVETSYVVANCHISLAYSTPPPPSRGSTSGRCLLLLPAPSSRMPVCTSHLGCTFPLPAIRPATTPYSMLRAIVTTLLIDTVLRKAQQHSVPVRNCPPHPHSPFETTSSIVSFYWTPYLPSMQCTNCPVQRHTFLPANQLPPTEQSTEYT